MDPYATTSDLSEFVGVAEGELPPDTDRLLKRASTLIDTIPTLIAFDIDDTTGIPTDGDVADAMKEAVCAQVEFWFEIGGGAQDPNTVGEAHDILRLVGDQKIGDAGIPGLKVIAPRAADILRSVGMLRSGVSPQGSTLYGEFFTDDD